MAADCGEQSETQSPNTSLKNSEAHLFHLRFICPIHPYSAATIQTASHDETIMIQALGYTLLILNALYLGTFSALKQRTCESFFTQIYL